MGATNVFKLPWPELGDLADGPDGYQDLAAAVEAALLGQRDADDSLTWVPAWTSSGTQPKGASTYGTYRVRSKLCTFTIWATFAASVNGGNGQLQFSLPVRARASINQQVGTAKYLLNGLGHFSGWCYVNASGLAVGVYLPTNADSSLLGPWSNSSVLQIGTGTPNWPGHFSVTSGSNMCLSGSYFV